MARCSFIPLLSLVTFLVFSEVFTSARTVLPQDIVLVLEPEENYYILKKKPVSIVCQAKNAAEISFSCMGTQIPPSSVEVKDVSDIDANLIQAEIKVSQDDLQNQDGQEKLWCQCSALDVAGQAVVTSRKGFVYIASLKNKFVSQPSATSATEGEDVEIICEAPEGEPKPEIMWRKDKKRLEVENTPRLIITDSGSLQIMSVTKEDAGYYQCVARNPAGRRESESAQLLVTGDSSDSLAALSVEEMKSQGSAKPRATRQSIKTYFTTEPQEKYYITPDKPVLIDCGAVAADVITFRCNNKRMHKEQQTAQQGLVDGVGKVIQAQLTLNHSEVQAFQSVGGGNPFQCLCVAWYTDPNSASGWGKVVSNANQGLVYPAYLNQNFSAQPSDVKATLGSQATFVCEPPEGQPAPWVVWYKANSRLDPRSSDKYFVSAQGHLTIRRVQGEDAGSYWCLAENTVASVQSLSAQLVVTAEAVETTTVAPTAGAEGMLTFPAVIPSTPMFIRDLEAEINLGPDGTVMVECAVVAAEQLTFECGGQRLAPNEYHLKSEMHEETGKRLLHAKAVIVEERLTLNPDDYFCQCTAWYLVKPTGWANIISSKGYIRKAAETSYLDQKFQESPSDLEVYPETGVQLNCVPPAGNPTPEVYWLKDGVVIDPQTDVNFVVVNGVLYIEFVTESDQGKYTCVAHNEAGTRYSDPVQLTVLALNVSTPQTEEVVESTQQPEESTDVNTESTSQTWSEPKKPRFEMDLDETYHASEDLPAELSCSVIGATNLLFVCNGQVLRETVGTGFSIVLPQTNEVLRQNSLNVPIDKVLAFTETTPYTCLCRAYFNPDGKPMSVDSSSASILVSNETQSPASSSDLQVAYLERVTLPCDITADSQITWLKDEEELVASERIILDEGTLIIQQFQDDDEGTYTCFGYNSLNQKESHSTYISIYISTPAKSENTFVTEAYSSSEEPDATVDTVVDGEQLYVGSPYISKDLHSVYYIAKNRPVSISCEAYSVQFITFTCGTREVQEQDTREREEELTLSDGKSSLVKVIEASINVTKEEVENYGAETYFCQCFAYYQVPGIEAHQTLNSTRASVEIAYIRRNFATQPQGQVVKKGSLIKLSCEPPAGNPTPTVTWTRNEEDIKALSVSENGLYIFAEAELEHAGEYVCIAENDAGRRSSTPVQVEVQEMDVSTPVTTGNERNECPRLLYSCTSLLPRHMDQLDHCDAVPAFKACVDNYVEKCTGIVNEVSIDTIKMASEGFQKKCALKTQCPQLSECKRVTSNSLEDSEEDSDLTVTAFCRDTSALLDCVDMKLEDCGVPKLSPEEDVRASLHEVGSWFSQYCNRLIVRDSSLESCEAFSKCDLNVYQSASDNTSYWCGFISSLEDCTRNAITSCELEEFHEDVTYLQTQANENFCQERHTDESFWDETTENTPEAENKVDDDDALETTSSSALAEDSTDENDEKDKDDGDGETDENETKVELGASRDEGSGSAVARCCLPVAVILAVLSLVNLAWR